MRQTRQDVIDEVEPDPAAVFDAHDAESVRELLTSDRGEMESNAEVSEDVASLFDELDTPGDPDRPAPADQPTETAPDGAMQLELVPAIERAATTGEPVDPAQGHDDDVVVTILEDAGVELDAEGRIDPSQFE